jgi:hypothetical protein
MYPRSQYPGYRAQIAQMIAELEKVWKEMVAADGDTIPAFFLRG